MARLRRAGHAPPPASPRGVAAALGRHHHTVAVALITPAGIRLGGRGAGRDARFEIGSISKALTGLLLADAVERGEVSLDTRLGDLLEVGDALAGITLGALATHRAGLPRVPAAAQPARRTWELVRHGRNPYREDLEGLLAQARTVRPRGHRASYSNLGFQLLGHALGAAAGRPYAALVVERLATPLGMTGVTVPAGPAELTATDLTGVSRGGRPREPWTGEALGPAGGIRATAGDMGLLARALLGGRAPGMAALEPRGRLDRTTAIGLGWLVTAAAGRDITWHNGGTGGFRSWMGLDRDAGTGVVILSAHARGVDAAGFVLLTGRVADGAITAPEDDSGPS